MNDTVLVKQRDGTWSMADKHVPTINEMYFALQYLLDSMERPRSRAAVTAHTAAMKVCGQFAVGHKLKVTA